MCGAESDPTQYERPMAVTPTKPAIHEVSGQRQQTADEVMAIVGRVMDRKFGSGPVDGPGSCDVCHRAFATWEAYCRHLPGEVRAS